MSSHVTRRPAAYDHAPFLRSLAVLSAGMGRDISRVQGPGGNTSLKHEGVLWVKASGTDLADADKTCIFVPVDLGVARQAIADGDDKPIPALDLPQAEGMRPSIECSLHALMPHRVVLHNHDVNVIAWAARADAESALAAPLQGLNWAFVPYARPGLPLTRAVRDVMESRAPDILILGNHGLVVGGETPDDAAGRLDAVRERLELRPRAVPASNRPLLDELSRGTAFAPAVLKEAHWTALDETSLRVAAGGTLYPDHVVFLGPELEVVQPDAAEPAGTQAKLVAVRGAGVLIEDGLPAAAQAMAACLGLVAARFPEDAEPAYLRAEDIAVLLGWDAERYRQEQARRKAASQG